MNPIRPFFAMAALLALLAAPAFAAGHCDHASAEAQAADVARSGVNDGAQHHQHVTTAAAEEIPGNGANGESACQHHAGEVCQCRSQMALSCAMEGCCIKADGPLSTGFNDRLPTGDDHALSVQTVLPVANGQTAASTIFQMILPRDLTGPDPRPPAA